MLSAHFVTYVASRSLKTKDGKEFVLLSFVGDDGQLYADVFCDGCWSDVLSSKQLGEVFQLNLDINRYNSQWRVSVSSII